MNLAESEVLRELDSGERLLWSAMPRQGLRVSAADLFLVPFSLLWGGFAIFWETMVLTSGAPTIMALFGIPFVAMGLYLIAGRFFVDARVRAHTYYGLTDRRVVVVTGVFSRRVTSFGLKNLGGVELSERSDGSGSISFGAPLPFPYAMQGAAWPGMQRMGGRSFSLIENARAVHAQVMKARDAMK